MTIECPEMLRDVYLRISKKLMPRVESRFQHLLEEPRCWNINADDAYQILEEATQPETVAVFAPCHIFLLLSDQESYHLTLRCLCERFRWIENILKQEDEYERYEIVVKNVLKQALLKQADRDKARPSMDLGGFWNELSSLIGYGVLLNTVNGLMTELSTSNDTAECYCFLGLHLRFKGQYQILGNHKNLNFIGYVQACPTNNKDIFSTTMDISNIIFSESAVSHAIRTLQNSEDKTYWEILKKECASPYTLSAALPGVPYKNDDSAQNVTAPRIIT